MGIESLLTALGLGELALNPAFVAQVVVMTLTALFFFGALAVSIIAFRSAAVAHYAKADAESHLRTAKSLASEVRSLTAQVESRAMTARAAVPHHDTHAAHSAGHDDHHAEASHHDDHHDDHHADHAAHDDRHDDHHAASNASKDDHHDDEHHAKHADSSHDISPVIAARMKRRHSHAHDHGHSHANAKKSRGDEGHDKSLDAAAKAATVPYALLRRRRWDS